MECEARLRTVITAMGSMGFPREASRLGLERGDAVIQFTLTPAGEIKDVKELSASHPIFARSSIRIVQEYRCEGQDRDVRRGRRTGGRDRRRRRHHP